ncbi:hypothetical protein D3874_06965 [Oleomonas cavernae]|uniref:Uncharacterized protein n=1 Tax=Oleomonas cavernae TaxID=2320859 RepID=A0A418W9T6_9PROT|nr:hypothetical protein [Oleomonas cavernae]RJF86791.1 hypothetical protein D3874_06965 [Oleomonas cavernae]
MIGPARFLTVAEARRAVDDWWVNQSNTEPASDAVRDQWLMLDVWLHELEELKNKIREGDKAELLRAMRICAGARLVTPEWLAVAFIEAYDSVARRFEAGSWDDIFGKPVAKGTHVGRLRERRRKRIEVYRAVKLALRADPPPPVDQSLFELVGKVCCVSPSVAKELYYSVKNQLLR